MKKMKMTDDFFSFVRKQVKEAETKLRLNLIKQKIGNTVSKMTRIRDKTFLCVFQQVFSSFREVKML
jgi:hypothetical protein